MPLLQRKRYLNLNHAGVYAPAPAGGVVFALDFTGNSENNVGGTSATFTAVAIGVADANRVVGVGVAYRANADVDTVSSMTIGGVGATQVSGARSTRSDGGGLITDIWYASVPTGTTANIVVNYSASVVRSGVSAYRIITSTPTPTASVFAISLASGVGPTSSITVPSGGAGLAMFGTRGGSTPVTWTNATHDYSATIGAGLAVVSSAKFTATNTLTAVGNGTAGAAISAATWS